MRTRPPRALRRAALAPVALLLCASVAAAGGAPRGACAGVDVRGGWKKISVPVPARGFTVDARSGVVVAGDSSIMSSADGGCSWTTSYELTSPGAGEGFAALASTRGSLVAATSSLRVFVSRDGGATWDAGGRGLDLPAEPVGIYGSRESDAVYLVARQEVTDAILSAAGLPQHGAGVSATVVYRSDDGGSTWERRGDPALAYSGPRGSDLSGGGAPGALWDLAVDPADPDHLLAASRGGVFRSVDGGARWSLAAGSADVEARTVSIARPPDGPPVAVAVDPRLGTLFETRDVAAGDWSVSRHPQLRTELMSTYPDAAPWASSAFAGGGAVLAGPKGIFLRAARSLADVTPPHAATGVADVQAFGAPWARSDDGTSLFTPVAGVLGGSGGDAGGSTPAVRGEGSHGLPPDHSVSVPPVRRGVARLDPRARTVTLDPGESRTLTYRATIEPQPAAVDVYFLVDTTSSMATTLRSLTLGMEQIVGRLARSGIELRAGVGAFRSYPRETDRHVEDYPYRRIRALGPVDEGLVGSLYELEGAGSSGANLTALYQAVTGVGQDVLPPGPSKGDVAPGLDAGFGDRATNVVVHFADTWFGTPDRGDPNGYYAPGTWPGPSFDDVSAVLRAKAVRHLGVAMQPSGGGTVLTQADVREDLRRLSLETSSLVAERGADCDGDGAPDLTDGAPLVCVLERDADASGLASVVVGLVEALEHRGDVSLVEDGSGVVSAIDPAVYPGLDLRTSNVLEFDVTVRCAHDAAGSKRSSRLSLQVAGQPAAGATARVVCRDLPAVRVKPPETRVPLIPPIPAPPPPPHSVPGLGPGSVTAPAPVQAPAPAQAPGGQPQATVVAQRQQQPQLAFVAAVQQVRSQTQMQHAMVRTSARDPLAAAQVWIGAGALTMLWAWGLARSLARSEGLSFAGRRRRG
jgi:hypothetical protein